MKALILEGKNQPLVFQERPDPMPDERDSVVEIFAAALNHRDLWIKKGLYAGLKYPIILGSDGAGVVRGQRSSTDGQLPAREVIIYPAMAWGDLQSHQDPKNFKILGLPENGTFAELVKVPTENLFPKPAHLTFEEAACLPLAGLTAYRALFPRGLLKAGEKVLITGIGGGVATLALQFAIAAGAQVYITSGSPEKIRKAKSLGAIQGFSYLENQWALSAKAVAGSFDLIVDGAGGDGVNHLLDLVKPGGRVLFYGATKGNATQIEIRRIFWKQINVMGSTMGSEKDFVEMLSFVNSHGIKPIIDQIYPLSEGESAFRKMDEGIQFGKIILKMS